MASSKTTTKSSSSTTSTQSSSTSKSTSRNVLDEALLAQILGGLSGEMTRAEIEAYAKSLLMPQLNAGLEAARQTHETAKLSREQEIENLAAELTRSVEEQNRAYQKSMADISTAALARGMGRSSYTLETMKNRGVALAQAVERLTQENERRSAQIQSQITKSAEHSAQTQARLSEDYAMSLAAKIQEIEREQRREKNSQYLTAVSAAMGRETIGESQTQGTSQTQSKSTTTTTSGKSGSSSGAKKKKEEEIVDAVSSAAPSVRQMTGR